MKIVSNKIRNAVEKTSKFLDLVILSEEELEKIKTAKEEIDSNKEVAQDEVKKSAGLLDKIKSIFKVNLK